MWVALPLIFLLLLCSRVITMWWLMYAPTKREPGNADAEIARAPLTVGNFRCFRWEEEQMVEETLFPQTRAEIVVHNVTAYQFVSHGTMNSSSKDLVASAF